MQFALVRAALLLILAFGLFAPATAATDPAKITVYITKTGEKYHEGSCRYLRKSKIKTTLKDAKANGYTACSVCDPPE